MEKCELRCKHSQCTKRCSEPCDRKLCEHPKDKILKKCGHESIGVCGEESPRLCRICDKVEFKKISSSSEEGARFIELKDCKHIIEINKLMQLMQSDPALSESNSKGHLIQFMQCPRCKTVIRHTKSLLPYIWATLTDIQQVKMKVTGNRRENKMAQLHLNRKAEKILDAKSFKVKTAQLRSIYVEILHKTEFNKKCITKAKQILLTNKFVLAEALKKICVAFEKRRKSHQNILLIDVFKDRVRMAAAFIASADYSNSEQQRNDITTEISVLQMMGDVIVKSSGTKINDTAKQLLNEAFELANECGSATQSVREEFAGLVSEACKHSPELEISLEENRMVLQAASFQRGHWYKCPNGHVYCIADCGGVMERSKCPECASVVDSSGQQI